jgi:hypothetical protein
MFVMMLGDGVNNDVGNDVDDDVKDEANNDVSNDDGNDVGDVIHDITFLFNDVFHKKWPWVYLENVNESFSPCP